MRNARTTSDKSAHTKYGASNGDQSTGTMAALLTDGIGCDACDKAKAPIQCRDCKAAYYCSEQCLLHHAAAHQATCHRLEARQWRSSVDSVDPLTAGCGATVLIPNKDLSNSGEESTVQVCSICLEDPNARLAPLIRLDACHHLFCLPCLIQWERKRASDVNPDARQPSFPCPNCRTQSVDPEQYLLRKAKQTFVRARHPGCPPELKDSLLTDAFKISSALLQVSEPELGPMCVLAEVLLALNRPANALATTRRILKMDKERHEATDSRVLARSNGIDSAERTGTSLSSLERATMYQSLYLLQGEAYQNLGKWPEALRVYQLLLKVHTEAPLPSGLTDSSHACSVDVRIWRGLAACYYETNDYGASIEAANRSLALDRSAAGVHRLKALALVKQAEHSPIMAASLKRDAAHTMNQGVLYEAPWDPEMQANNRQLYHSLSSGN
jgi:tetratricopeptide (TPR) repeat protein